MALNFRFSRGPCRERGSKLMEDNHESKSNIGLPGLQAKKLQYHEEQEKRS